MFNGQNLLDGPSAAAMARHGAALVRRGRFPSEEKSSGRDLWVRG